jgi:hypothetical protein
VVRTIALALGLVACGRLDVDPVPDGMPTSDAPPVPAAICNVTRFPVDATPSTADLTIAPISEGYAALWVDTTRAQPAQGMLLGPNLQMLGAIALPDITDLQLGGIADVGQKLVLSSATGNTETLRILGRDLRTASTQSTLTQHVMGHDTYPSDSTQKPRAFVTAVVNQIVVSNVAEDGLVNPAFSVFDASGSITDLVCTDGPNHAHCAWAEGTSPAKCTIADVNFNAPAPMVGGTIRWAEECRELRNVSGPDSADSMIVVWSTPARTVEAHYAVSTGDKLGRIAQLGSAPKVRFDGSRFWIAWLDGQGQLRLSSFDLNGTIVPYSLAGWTPLGPEAFELVHRGGTTGVVLLSAGELDFLTICP